MLRKTLFLMGDCLSGMRLMGRLSRLRKTQYLSRSDLEKIRREKFLALLRHSFEAVPYYRRVMERLGLSPDRVSGLQDLQQFPVLTKEIIRSQGEAMMSSAFSRSQLVRGQTGGSTGSPLVYYLDPETRASIRAHYYRGLEWMGWRPGDPIVSLWGRPIRPTLKAFFKGTLRFVVTNHREVDAHELDDKNLAHSVALLRRSPRTILIGYASALTALARYLVKSKERRPKLRAVMSTAEMLTNSDRAFLRESFACRIFNAYGLSEVQSIGYECPEGRIHLCEERVLVEIGPEGNALVTDLDNRAMPFLRYDTGDILEIASGLCSCKRTLGLIRSIQGRACDIIEGANGRRAHAEYFTHLLEEFEIFARYQVRQFQVVQESPEFLVLRLAASKRPLAGDLEKISRAIRERLGNVKVAFEFPLSIPKGGWGKHRFVIPYGSASGAAGG